MAPAWRTLPALLLLFAWLVPDELAFVWRLGGADVELRARGADTAIESLMLLEPDQNPSGMRVALLWRF